MRRPVAIDQRARVLQSTARLLESLEGCPLVTVSCPACGSDERFHATTRQGMSYVRCTNCSCVYADRRPTEEALVQMYRRFPDCAAGHETAPYDPRDEAREARYRLGCIRQVARSGRLLDVGCGRGDFLKAARHSFRVVGVDVAARMTPPDEGIPLFDGPLEDAAFEEGSFHVVTAFEVLEHLFDPTSALRAVHRVLAADGVFVFQTGDADSFRARLNLESWPYLQPPVHLNILGRRSLAILMRRTGFRVVKAWSFGRAPHRIMGMTRFPNPEVLRPLLDVVARVGLVGRMYAALRVDA